MKFNRVDIYGMGVAKLLPLHADRQILVDSSGNPYQIKGVTSFKLANLYETNLSKAEAFISAYQGFNTHRVFLYTSKKDWGNESWESPSKDVVVNFISWMRDKGKYVKLVLLTDDDPARIQPAIDLMNYLIPFRFDNLLPAAGNEPLTHKTIDVTALNSVFARSSYLYTSGVYEDTKKFYGKFGDDHSARDSEWPRKAHNMYECYNGGGPNSQDEPATKVPWLEGEPIKPNEALNYGDQPSVIRDYYAYAATCTQFGCGGFYHCESAKFCNTPNDFEASCSDIFYTGLNVFPPNTALGGYRRIDEQGKTLRTYVVGNTMVRIRPKTLEAPEGNWNSLDPWGICWSRS